MATLTALRPLPVLSGPCSGRLFLAFPTPDDRADRVLCAAHVAQLNARVWNALPRPEPTWLPTLCEVEVLAD